MSYEFIEMDRERGSHPVQFRDDSGQEVTEYHHCPGGGGRGELVYAVGVYGQGMPAKVPWSAPATCTGCGQVVVRWFEWRSALVLPRP